MKWSANRHWISAAKLNTVILPKLNERDLIYVPESIKRAMTSSS